MTLAHRLEEVAEHLVRGRFILHGHESPFFTFVQENVSIEGTPIRHDILGCVVESVQIRPTAMVEYGFIGCDVVSSPLHPLDTKYPHECYYCGRELYFKELLDRNAKITQKGIRGIRGLKVSYDYAKYKHLKKLWRSKVVQFYCCRCYDERVKQK